MTRSQEKNGKSKIKNEEILCGKDGKRKRKENKKEDRKDRNGAVDAYLRINRWYNRDEYALHSHLFFFTFFYLLNKYMM